MKHYAATKSNEVLIHITTWVKLGDITAGNKEKASHKDCLCYDTIDLKYAKWASPRDRKYIAIC